MIASSEVDRPLRAFVSYAHEDALHLEQLQVFVALLADNHLLAPWADTQLSPGDRWAERVDAALADADLFLALVGARYFASEFCKQELNRAAAGNRLRVIPIICEPCPWQDSVLARFQALPDGARAISTWPNANEAWNRVATGIKRVVEDLRGAARRAAATAAPRAAPGTPVDWRRYLRYLVKEHEAIDVRGMGAQVAERLPLDQVYIRLRAVGRAAEQREAKPFRADRGTDPGAAHAFGERGTISLAEAMTGARQLAIIGDPGSGKTTFLRFLTQRLGRAHLGEHSALADTGIAVEGGRPPPFPILVRASQLGEYLREYDDAAIPDDAPEHLWRYLDYTLVGHDFGLPQGALRGRIRDPDSECLLLVDGLDEVPGEPLRQRISRLLDKVVRLDEQNRHVITCRTRAWEGLTALGADLALYRLAPLAPDQVEAFLENWCKALFRVPAGGPLRDEPRASAYHTELSRAIEDNPATEAFTANPLMLTVLAVLHWNQKRLPEQRAELYEQAVKWLLESRASQAAYSVQKRGEALQAIAIAMFEDQAGVQRSIGRHEAAQAVARMTDLDEAAALALIDTEELLSHILVSRRAGEIEFWHLMFQEFLAARELAQDREGYWARLAAHLHDDRWRELVLLLAGLLRRDGGSGPRSATKGLLRRILERDREPPAASARAVALCHRIVADLKAYDEEPAAGTPYAERLHETLSLFEPGGPDVEESVRVEVAEALGQAGDPRLADAEAQRIRLPAGRFVLGAQKGRRHSPNRDGEANDVEHPVHEVNLAAFRIGRYPVTVGEFESFLAANDRGYQDPRQWEPRGWAWREREGFSAPADWERQRRRRNVPVTGVSWYEADAYVRWVGGALPTEAQWERAARGAKQRRYPWGDQVPDPARASFEGRFDAAVPVGCYPRGATPEGVCDLAGNVWEWCRDWFGTYPATGPDDYAGPEQGEYRVLRGGSFDLDAGYLRAAYRLNAPPVSRYVLVGFRVVWCLPREPIDP